MKLKLSTMVLVGAAILIVSGMFISSFILRQQYDTINKQDKYWYYTKMSQEPFKHIKIQQNRADSTSAIPSIGGTLKFEEGNSYSVLSNPIRYGHRWNSPLDDTLSVRVINDTLFIQVSSSMTYFNNGKEVSYDILLTAPKLESITCVSASSHVTGLNQDNLTFDLSGRSILTFENNFRPFSSIKAVLKDNAVLELSSLMTVKTLEADLKNHSKLRMPTVAVDSFRLSADDGTAVEAPSRLLKVLK